jgi:hypothetical protein
MASGRGRVIGGPNGLHGDLAVWPWWLCVAWITVRPRSVMPAVRWLAGANGGQVPRSGSRSIRAWRTETVNRVVAKQSELAGGEPAEGVGDRHLREGGQQAQHLVERGGVLALAPGAGPFGGASAGRRRPRPRPGGPPKVSASGCPVRRSETSPAGGVSRAGR